jgi:hypothetical protein
VCPFKAIEVIPQKMTKVMVEVTVVYLTAFITLYLDLLFRLIRSGSVKLPGMMSSLF